jgi:hypothetical protein
MKTRRAMMLIAALALLGAACGAGSATTTAAPPASNTLASSPATTAVPDDALVEPDSEAASPGVLTALRRATDSGSGRMEGSLTMLGINGFPGGTLELPFNGSFAANGDYSFALDMSGLAEASGEEIPQEFAFMLGEMEIRQIGDTSYIRYPFFSMMFGLETDWLAAPADESSQLTDGFGFATPTRPTDILGSFGDAAASISDLGRERVNGLEVTHYRVLFDTEALYAMASPEERAGLEAEGIPDFEFPMDVWITDTGILTRFVMDIEGSAVADTDGDGFERMLVAYDLFDLGADIEVEVPPASDITSADELGDFFSISP